MRTKLCSDCECSVTEDELYYSTPCGTFCPDCMDAHAEECKVCANEFGLHQEEEERMNSEYRVIVSIERCDFDNESPLVADLEEIGEPVLLGCFKTQKEAEEFVDKIPCQ